MTGATDRPAARAGAIGTVVTGIGIAVLQALQGVLGSFDPRWEVTALLALAGICATLVASRLAARRQEAGEEERRQALRRRSLRAWPIPRLDEADSEALGVFPARRDEPTTTYVPRPRVDSRLRDALRDSALVVLVGPPRSGKSRTMLEAARRALGGASVIVPRDARALRDLLALDPKLAFAGAERVLWLDGLERHIGALDAETVDELCRGDTRTPIVATLRERTWAGLLATDGVQGEVAKTLTARARVFELPLRLEADELNEGRRTYGSRDFSAGIGPALSSTGRESNPPLSPRTDGKSPTTEKQGEVLHDRLLVLPAVGCVLALLAVVGLLVTRNFDTPKPPTIAEQAADARREGSAGTRVVVDAERADFRGSGENSYFFVFGDEPGVPAGQARSDQLQVLDRRGDELVEAFEFEPRQPNPAERALFQFRFIGDIDGDGADELVGGFGTPAIRGELLLPFALDWNEDAGQYEVISLAARPPRLASKARGADVAGLRAAYRNPLTLNDDDRSAERSLKGYRSQDFAVSENPHRLVSSYVADISQDRTERLVELRPQTFDRTSGRPRVSPCKLAGRDKLVRRVPSAKARSLHSATLERWLEASRGQFCLAP